MLQGVSSGMRGLSTSRASVIRKDRMGTAGQGKAGRESDQCPGWLQVREVGRAVEMQLQAVNGPQKQEVISSLAFSKSEINRLHG